MSADGDRRDHPPAAAEALLHRLSSRAAGRFIVGDLREEYRSRRRRGALRAKAWYWGEALRLGVRLAWETGPLRGSMEDLRFASRILLRRPGFTATAALTLALGIGGATVIVSVVDAVLLRPLPYPDADRLVVVWQHYDPIGLREVGVRQPDLAQLRARSELLEAVEGFEVNGMDLTGEAEPERVHVARVTPGLPEMLAGSPTLGRVFDEADAARGTPVAMVGHGLWRRRYAGDPGLLGRQIDLNGESYVVVGVMPPGFGFPEEAQVWTPIELETTPSRGLGGGLNAVGRLRPGATLEQARWEVDAIAAALEERYPESNEGWGFDVVSLHRETVGDHRAGLLLLLGGAGLLLLVACANVVNLALSRTLDRRPEIAMRAALGASPWRVGRQLVLESVLIAGLGCVGGLLLAGWGLELLPGLLPADVPRVEAIGLHGRGYGFSAATALLVGLVLGVLSGVGAARRDVGPGRPGSGPGGGASRLSRACVALEVAQALALLIGAALVSLSFLRLLATAPGVDPGRVLTVDLTLEEHRYGDSATSSQKRELVAGLLPRLVGLPGVESAAATNNMPLTGAHALLGVSVEDPEAAERARRGAGAAGSGPVDAFVDYKLVTGNHFRTVGLRFLDGRVFRERERREEAPVVVVSEALAAEFWPGERAVGQRIKRGGRDSGDPWLTVIGVVEDAPDPGLLAAVDPQARSQGGMLRRAVYFPYLASPVEWLPGSLVLTLRTADGVDPDHVVSDVRSLIRSMDPALPAQDVRTLDERLASSLALQRFQVVILGAFATLALLLAAIGVHGVLGRLVAHRTREIGVRKALGAGEAVIVREVVGDAMTWVLAGIVLGLATGAAAARLMEGLLYEVAPLEPRVYLASGLGVALVAAVATWVPARRATRVDPFVALRAD